MVKEIMKKLVKLTGILENFQRRIFKLRQKISMIHVFFNIYRMIIQIPLKNAFLLTFKFRADS